MIKMAEIEIEDCVQPESATDLGQLNRLEQFICPVDEAARIIGQKWTLQIVHELLDHSTRRFCEIQEALGGVNPSTLSSRLKMLEEEGIVHRAQVSTIPPHVDYSLTPMGHELRGVIQAITKWSNTWLCAGQEPCYSEDGELIGSQCSSPNQLTKGTAGQRTTILQPLTLRAQ